ncbi:MAG: hypothetical protein WCW52_03685 [Elusimicrobiales bacterium]|jgi:hypothetical protein
MTMFRRYSGRGIISGPNNLSVNCRFRIYQNSDGEISGRCAFTGNHGIAVETPGFTLSGKLAGGYAFSNLRITLNHVGGSIGRKSFTKLGFVASHLELQNNTIPPGPFIIRFFLTNFIFHGINFTRAANGGGSRDHFCTRVGSHNITIRHLTDYDTIRTRLRKERGIEVTSTLEFTTTKNFGWDGEKRFATNICEMLSFATGTKINWIALELLDTVHNPVLCHHLDTLTFDYSPSLPVICDDINPPTIPNFLSQCYPEYRRWRSRLKIHVAIEYEVKSKHETVSEFKYLLAGTAMESLKENFRIWKGLPVRKPGTRQRWYFSELLELLYQHFRLRRRKFKFIALRNKVVHSGTLRGGYRRSSFPHYLRLTDLINRLLLRILDYRGTYYDCVNGKEKKFRC